MATFFDFPASYAWHNILNGLTVGLRLDFQNMGIGTDISLLSSLR